MVVVFAGVYVIIKALQIHATEVVIFRDIAVIIVIVVATLHKPIHTVGKVR